MKNKLTTFILLAALLPAMAVACDKPAGKPEDKPSDKREIKYRGTAETYKYFEGLIPSLRYTVSVNGARQYVYPTEDQDICIFACKDTVCVEISSPSQKITSAIVRPIYKNTDYWVADDKVIIYMAPKDRLVVDINGDNGKESLILFANPIDSGKPDRNAAGVRYYEAGKVHSPGPISLSSGETLYIEGGAVLKSNVSCVDATGVTIAGGGILVSSPDENRPVNFKDVTDSHIRDITVINASNWTTTFNLCDNMDFDNFKVYATASLANESGNENDGMDMMACNRCTIKHCFSCCYDDTYCIKTQKWGYCGTTEGIHYEDCIAWNKGGGNSFEIGYELNQNVTDVSYKDIYSIHSASRIGSSGPFRRGATTIHCGAAGTISGIRYENVYIEDPAIYGIHMQILKTSYEIGTGVEWAPGVVKDVKMKNVHMAYMPVWFNVVKGYDATHQIELEIDGLYIGDTRITSASEGKFELSQSNLTIK